MFRMFWQHRSRNNISFVYNKILIPSTINIKNSQTNKNNLRTKLMFEDMPPMFNFVCRTMKDLYGVKDLSEALNTNSSGGGADAAADDDDDDDNSVFVSDGLLWVYCSISYDFFLLHWSCWILSLHLSFLYYYFLFFFWMASGNCLEMICRRIADWGVYCVRPAAGPFICEPLSQVLGENFYRLFFTLALMLLHQQTKISLIQFSNKSKQKSIFHRKNCGHVCDCDCEV